MSYKAKVIQANDIIQHPNADNLNLLRYGGEPSEIGHYYSHENVGAYEAMFYLEDKIIRLKDLLDAIALINFHMRPYMAKTDRAKEKLKKTVGEDLYYFLEILHEADKRAH